MASTNVHSSAVLKTTLCAKSAGPPSQGPTQDEDEGIMPRAIRQVRIVLLQPEMVRQVGKILPIRITVTM